MSIKTPEQIAYNLAQEWRDHRDHIVFTEGTLIGALREAIEVDRAQRTPEPEDSDFVVSITTGVTIPLKGARIVRNFSPELHAEDPENIVFYAEAHGKAIA